MSLVIPANSNRHRFDANGVGSNTGVSSGEILFSAEFPAGSSTVGDVFELRSQSQQIIKIRRNIAGRIQLRFSVVSGATQSFIDLGDAGSKFDIFVRWDDNASSDQLIVSVNGTETTIQHTEILRQSSNLNFQIESFFSSGETYIVHDVALKLGSHFTASDRSSYLTGTSPANFQTTPDYFVRPDGTGYPATISSNIGAVDFVHTNTTAGETDSGSANAPSLTTSATGPAILSVTSPSGADTIEMRGQLTVVLGSNANVGSITANARPLTNLSLNADGQTVTADVGFGVWANIGDTVDIVVNNGVDSSAHPVTVTIPSTHSFVILSVKYDDLPVQSDFYGEIDYSPVDVGDVWIYDNLGGTLTFSPELISSIDPPNTVDVDGSGWFYEQSDSYSPDGSLTIITHNPPPSLITPNPGIRTDSIMQPNADILVVDVIEGNVHAVGRDSAGGTEIFDLSEGTITNGVYELDSDLIGQIDSTGELELRWSVSGESRFVAIPYTVIDLDA